MGELIVDIRTEIAVRRAVEHIMNALKANDDDGETEGDADDTEA